MTLKCRGGIVWKSFLWHWHKQKKKSEGGSCRRKRQKRGGEELNGKRN